MKQKSRSLEWIPTKYGKYEVINIRTAYMLAKMHANYDNRKHIIHACTSSLNFCHAHTVDCKKWNVA